MILVEHKMKLVMGICDRILVLHHGELLAEGAPDDIRAQRGGRRVYLGQSALRAMLEGDATSTPGTARSHVLQGVSLEVAARARSSALIGRNGAGKTTTLRTIMGLVRARRTGSVRFDGATSSPSRAHSASPRPRLRARGAAHRARDDGAGEPAASAWSPRRPRPRGARSSTRIAETFPRLKERLDQQADTLSGGEQQMLAIARAMMAEPEDDHARRAVRRHHAGARRRDVRAVRAHEAPGITLLLVEQNVERALDLADRAYVMDQGEIVHEGRPRRCLPTRTSRNATARCEAHQIPRGLAGKAVALSKSGFLVTPGGERGARVGVRAPRVVRANRIGRQGSDPDRRIRHGPAPRRFWFLASHFGSGPLPVRALKRLRADPAV